MALAKILNLDEHWPLQEIERGETMSQYLSLSGLAALCLLSQPAAAEPAGDKACDYSGTYSGSCITRLAGEREGGVLVITTKRPDRSCEALADTAQFAANSYCSDISLSLRPSTEFSDGALPYTCDGAADGTYAASMSDILSQLVLDGAEEAAVADPRAALPDLPEGGNIAHMKFICVER